MPIGGAFDGPFIHTKIVGRVTDAELLAYYNCIPEDVVLPAPWRELVDGREMGEIAVTVDGQRRFAAFVSTVAMQLRGGRVAMLAASTAAYGVFRAWELRSADLGYDVRVFRELESAMEWLRHPRR